MDTISLFDTFPTDTVGSSRPIQVEIFDPPMCCSIGLCGPTVNQTLLSVNEMVMALQAEGVTVARYQMANDHQQFRQNVAVMQLVREQKMAALPITVIRGEVLKSGEYPTLAEIQASLKGNSA